MKISYIYALAASVYFSNAITPEMNLIFGYFCLGLSCIFGLRGR